MLATVSAAPYLRFVGYEQTKVYFDVIIIVQRDIIAKAPQVQASWFYLGSHLLKRPSHRLVPATAREIQITFAFLADTESPPPGDAS